MSALFCLLITVLAQWVLCKLLRFITISLIAVLLPFCVINSVCQISHISIQVEIAPNLKEGRNNFLETRQLLWLWPSLFLVVARHLKDNVYTIFPIVLTPRDPPPPDKIGVFKGIACLWDLPYCSACKFILTFVGSTLPACMTIVSVSGYSSFFTLCSHVRWILWIPPAPQMSVTWRQSKWCLACASLITLASLPWPMFLCPVISFWMLQSLRLSSWLPSLQYFVTLTFSKLRGEKTTKFSESIVRTTTMLQIFISY